MGCGSINTQPQILLLGLDGAGKTTFLYSNKWDYFEPTMGFNYEEIKLRSIVKASVWDVSGKSTLRCLWPTIYKNIQIKAVIFVIDANKSDRFLEARKELLFLVNEEELRECCFLIVFNFKGSCKLGLDEMGSKVGVDLVHQMVKIKTVLIDLMEDDVESSDGVLWLCEQLDR